MIDPATFDCVYAGCMNPKLPHLAIMNGYPEGVFEGHSYSLWKNDDGAVRLGIAEVDHAPVSGIVSPMPGCRKTPKPVRFPLR